LTSLNFFYNLQKFILYNIYIYIYICCSLFLLFVYLFRSALIKKFIWY
ncbi:hypothetical protein PFHG_03593, partial [Plasmodium falciparum HB3]